MKYLLKNARVVNVFTDTVEEGGILLDTDAGIILGVGAYKDTDADAGEDLGGAVVCPGFIDGHIHIESTMLQPAEFARVCVPHGTTTVVADPHEIANVSGLVGVLYMLQASENIPLDVRIVIPSCVPASPFDEAGAVLGVGDVAALLASPRVLGLGEMMNYPGVLSGDPDVTAKLQAARAAGKLINGHAPLLSGRALDSYIAAGIFDDHECSSADEARERIRKGQWLMIRQGTAARNLEALLPLFDEPWCRRCLLVTDDKHPADLLTHGHIDSIIRQAGEMGKSVLTGIRMATLQAAERFCLHGVGAVAPGYTADLCVLSDLQTVTVRDVWHAGKKVVSHGRVVAFSNPFIRSDVWKTVRNSFYLDPLTPAHFSIAAPVGDRHPTARVIGIVPDQLITRSWETPVDLSLNNGVDTARDIIKLAVVERHMNSGHIGLGYIHGLGLRKGAIASSVSHDSHNLIVAGVTDNDMAAAANAVREMGGGLAVVCGGQIIAAMPLPIGGLMSKKTAAEAAAENEAVRAAVHTLGAPDTVEPFMTLAFVSLPVIPDLKMTTQGLVDVTGWRRVGLFVE